MWLVQCIQVVFFFSFVIGLVFLVLLRFLVGCAPRIFQRASYESWWLNFLKLSSPSTWEFALPKPAKWTVAISGCLVLGLSCDLRLCLWRRRLSPRTKTLNNWRYKDYKRGEMAQQIYTCVPQPGDFQPFLILVGSFIVPPIAKATFIRSRVAKNRKLWIANISNPLASPISQSQRTPWHHLVPRSVQSQTCLWNQHGKMSQHHLSIGKLCSLSGLVVYIRSFQCMGAGLLETGITTSCWATAWAFSLRALCHRRSGLVWIGCRIFDQTKSRGKCGEWYGFRFQATLSGPIHFLFDAARFQSPHNRCGNCLQRCAVASTVSDGRVLQMLLTDFTRQRKIPSGKLTKLFISIYSWITH